MSKPHNILLIDHHNRDRAVCAAMLTGYGFRVQEARTLEEAQATLQSGYVPHTIIVDAKPADTSVDVLLAFAPAAARIIIVSNTEYVSTPGNRSQYEYVCKPVQPTELLNCIA